MAERVIDERSPARRLGSPFLPPQSFQNYLTSPTQVHEYIREKFGISDPGTIRAIDISRYTAELSSLGHWPRELLGHSPPIAVAVPDATFDQMGGTLGGDASAMGFYQRGSNVVFVRESLVSDPSRFDSVVRHELSHYLSYLARGGVRNHLTVEAPDGTVKPFFSQWLEEGLADFASCRAPREEAMRSHTACFSPL
jgi:hypothetical protein